MLTQDNFHQQTDSGRWLLDFYVPWCPHCKTLDPIFQAASVAAAEDGVELQFGKVDCDAQSALCKTLAVNGFPDLKFSAWGYRTEWMAGRELLDFTTFASTLKRPALQPLDRDLDAYPQLIKAVLVGAPLHTREAFAITAEKLRSHQDLLLLTTDRLDAIQSVSLPSLVIVSDDPTAPPLVLPVPETDTDSALFDMVLKHSYPMFPELTSSNWRHLTNNTTICIAVVDPAIDTSFKAAMKAVASKLKGNYQFAWMDFPKYKSFLSRTFYIDGPPTVLVLRGRDARYVDRTLSVKDEASIQDFLEAIERGTIEVEGPGSMKGLLKHYLYSTAYLFNDSPLIFGSLAALVMVLFGLMFFCSPNDDFDEKED